MLITPPAPKDYGFFNTYAFKVTDKDLFTALNNNIKELNNLVDGLTAEQLDYRYAEGKWSIKEVMLHLCQGERNFCYRSLRFACGDQTPIPVMDVDKWIANSYVTNRPIGSIMRELNALRSSTIAQFEGFDEEMLERVGPARDTMISVRALGYCIVGHVMHHTNIIHERYLQ